MDHMSKIYKFNIPFHDFLLSLTKCSGARNNFIQTIISSNFNACYLEFPELSKLTYSSPTEFVVIKADSFQTSNWNIFKDQFKLSGPGPVLSEQGSKDLITSFYNLTNDTLLVTPIPQKNKFDESSNHLMNYLKYGQKTQQHELIKEFAVLALELAENNKKVFISTHGRGVPWLHIRLAETPKYYQHTDYIKTTADNADTSSCILL